MNVFVVDSRFLMIMNNRVDVPSVFRISSREVTSLFLILFRNNLLFLQKLRNTRVPWRFYCKIIIRKYMEIKSNNTEKNHFSYPNRKEKRNLLEGMLLLASFPGFLFLRPMLKMNLRLELVDCKLRGDIYISESPIPRHIRLRLGTTRRPSKSFKKAIYKM